MPSISLIIPTYNMQRSLVRCLESVRGQTLLPSKVIIVDDGSTDGTADIVGAYCNTPVHLPVMFIRQEHTGASAARNRGCAASRGEYVMFLDADVVLMKKNAIKRLYEALRQKSKVKSQKLGVGYAYSSFRWGWKKFSSFPFDPEKLKQMPYIHTTSLIRRDVLPEKPFDESLKRLQDWDLYLTLLEQGVGGAFVPEVLFTVETKGTMSHWFPSIIYQIPFGKFGITIPTLEKYRAAADVVRAKHGL